MTELAKQSTVVAIGYVLPKSAAKASLTTGVYSLNKRSTVPFVQLRGTAGFQKTISWGEIAEIPENMTCTVVNDSYHGGDIFLNKGMDPCNRPSRITVPVRPISSFPNTVSGFYYVYMKYPCDTRGAKRAYLSIDAIVADGISGGFMPVNVRSRKLDGSMDTYNNLSNFAAPYGPGTGWLFTQWQAPGTFMGMIPLGFESTHGDTAPHNLLDATDVFITFEDNPTPSGNDWLFPGSQPSFVPAVSNPIAPTLPTMFYTVEYD